MNLLLTGCFHYTEVQKEKLASLGYRIHFVQQEKEALPLAAAEVDATVCNGLFLSHNIEDFAHITAQKILKNRLAFCSVFAGQLGEFLCK